MEFALVLPLFLLLIFGIIDFGRLLNMQIKVTEAAREGARAATVFTGSGAQRAAAAADRVETVDPDISIDGSSTYCEPPLGVDEDAVVTTSYEFTWVTPVGDLAAMLGGEGWGGTLTITGKGVMPCRA